VAALVGGGSRVVKPGEVSLAHLGCLFLDELSAYTRGALDALREPLEEGRVRISRQRASCCFPARFQLVAATNPCPCGFRDDPVVSCRCGDAERTSYDRRLSGPLLDRFDLMARLERPDPDLLLAEEPAPPSAVVAARVAAARLEQAERLARFGRATFGELAPAELRTVFRTDAATRATLAAAARALPLSGRGLDKVRRVSLTIACLEGAVVVGEDHVHEALSLRGGPLVGEG
jgi:magnesium chelatase family protein